ncbi:2-amino-4-hydroxy-6-hydroxymethyldihydropteridine diphosphokinase [Maricaulis sp. W15]|uniref:2-amino-4-hydroxy-6- hydroxymethyldihydropteridine diphosphokinase n=1 Tax=Maricaulis sp. W15 TaxID=1772333 RepID=UPI0009489124|nr:2-amino-4-hydroxy-6-hydroxymethyldihydropteridine diphosphokinase [Maricaulis sp. W15]
MQSAPIYIALGANLPLGACSPRETLTRARLALAEAGLVVVAASSDWHSPAWPDPSDPPYVNAAVEVESDRSAREILDTLHAIEAEFGRARGERNAPRPLDLDLIDWCGAEINDADGLVVPHPRATGRAFVLLPLAEIAPHWSDPASKRSIRDLIAALPQADRTATYKLQEAGKLSPDSLAFAGRGD